MSALEAELDRIVDGLERVGRSAAVEHATARRYCDLFGGQDDPHGEVWGHLAYVSDLVTQLAGWVQDTIRAGGLP